MTNIDFSYACFICSEKCQRLLKIDVALFFLHDYPNCTLKLVDMHFVVSEVRVVSVNFIHMNSRYLDLKVVYRLSNVSQTRFVKVFVLRF